MSEWKTKKIKDFAFTASGGTPSTERKDYWTEGTIPWINSGELSKNDVIRKPTTFITQEALENSSAKLFPIGTVVIALTGATTGMSAILEIETSTNQSITGIFPSKEHDSKFLLYTLRHNLDKILMHNVGSAQPHINKAIVDNLVFKYPDVSEQSSISTFLSTCDAVIEKTQAAIAKYKLIKQGMLYDLFTRGIDIQTGKLRPRYKDAPELYKESKLGWIPREWEVEEIGSCIDPIMSHVDKHIRADELKILLCNYMDVYTNRYLTQDISYSIGSVNSSEYFRFSLQPQDVIITKDSETPDDIAVPSILIEKVEDLICGYHLCILRSKDLNKLNGEFIMLQLQHHKINRQFANRANGTTRYGLTIDAIEESYLLMPSDLNEQLATVKRLRTIEMNLQSEQSYLEKMQQIKKGLMEDLLSGKKRVKILND